MTGEEYTIPSNAEIRNYGWAAIPYADKWQTCSQYTYILDYTKGVGVEDPANQFPGKAILYPIMVGVEGNSANWHTVNEYEEGESQLIEKDQLDIK